MAPAPSDVAIAISLQSKFAKPMIRLGAADIGQADVIWCLALPDLHSSSQMSRNRYNLILLAGMADPYFSEIKYLGGPTLDFIEIAVDVGTDVSDLVVTCHIPDGSMAFS